MRTTIHNLLPITQFASYHPDPNINFQINFFLIPELEKLLAEIGAKIKDFDDWKSQFLAVAYEYEQRGDLGRAARLYRAAEFWRQHSARVEGIAEPGGICISDDAQRQVCGKVDIASEDMRSQTLKNIVEPMRGVAFAGERKRSFDNASEPFARTCPTSRSPDKPSIAVLPFQNMSGDQE